MNKLNSEQALCLLALKAVRHYSLVSNNGTSPQSSLQKLFFFLQISNVIMVLALRIYDK